MIKRKFDIVPVYRSVKKFNSGMLVKNQQTGQFGLVHAGTLRGAQARRNLRNSFEPVALYVVEPDTEPAFDDFVIVTLNNFGQDSKIAGRNYEFSTYGGKTSQKIILYPGELLSSLASIDGKVFIPFRNLTSKTVNTLLQNGGHIWMEMTHDNIPRLDGGRHVIHLFA